jgi:hemolysin activation/secretion protein
VQVTGAPSVVFRKSGTEIRIKAERKKANSFNGVIGIRPQERTGKIVITGDAEIKLVNTFNSGDEIWVNWRRLQSQTQDLQLKVNAPYFGKIPFGAEGSMKIYRRDSTFSSFNGNIGILYQLGRGNTFRIFAEKSNSTGIGLATNATSLNLAGVRSTLYGVGLRYGKLDQKWNPRKGFYIDIDLSTGIRNIGLSQNDRPYNGIPDKKLWRVQGNIERYQPLWKKQTLRLAAIGGWYQTNPVFDNEMYRIGGLRTLRGISEETLFASSWVTGTMEYRFLFDENSAIYAFIDQNWYEKRGIQSLITDTPKGFGIGLNLSTGNGIFTFNYALGQQAGQELLIRNAKISFGFRNLF